VSESKIRLATLFADIGGSTRLYESLGDVHAHRLTAGCLETIADAVKQQGGGVVKTIGDEVMATFPTADQASRAARAIQAAIQTKGDTLSEEDVAVTVHVGFHFGPVLEEGGDVFGDAVNIAARMVSLANAGEILTTRQTVDCLGREECEAARQIDRRTVRGRLEALEIFEVIWQTAGLTQLMPLSSEVSHERLRMRMGDEQREVDRKSPSLTIGRDPDNDLVVPLPRASRWHARVDLLRGKFILKDKSTNGTLLRTPAGQRIVLRREELILPISGTVAIGEFPEDDRELPIRFELLCEPEGGGKVSP